MSVDRLGHVIVGGGHFIESGGRLIQEVVAHQEHMRRLYELGTRLNEFGVQSHVMPGQRLADRASIIQNGIVLVSDIESRAWQDYAERWADRSDELMKEAALSLGCALSGDAQGAVEHGVNAAGTWFDGLVEDVKSIWDRGTMPLSPDRG